jgi:mono/diheme cytochrome c family protein
MRNYSAMGVAILVCVALQGQVRIVAAQDKLLDFLGEVNDAEHPRGYRDYVEMQCWECHGYQGNGGTGPVIANGPMPYEAFANYVRRPANTMPAYSPNVLSEGQLRNIYEYLHALPPSPDAADIPLLSGE